jgi:hypothetical protein
VQVTSLPYHLTTGGIAPGAMPPAKRSPVTKIATGPQAVDKRLKPGEIVAAVGVAYNHIGASRRLYASQKCGPVTAPRYMNDSGSVRFRDCDRAIGAAVVGNENLAGNAAPLKELRRLFDTGGESSTGAVWGPSAPPSHPRTWPNWLPL